MESAAIFLAVFIKIVFPILTIVFMVVVFPRSIVVSVTETVILLLIRLVVHGLIPEPSAERSFIMAVFLLLAAIGFIAAIVADIKAWGQK